MPAKVVLSVYVDVEKDNEEVSAMVSDLVGRLGGVAMTTKRRKRRPVTDEEKAVFRARMIAGKEAKEKANEDADIDAKAEIDLEKKTAIAGSEPVEKKVSAKAKSATGRKTSNK